jgi:pimeloyl-ACP methyl ester carboxylesterase
MAALAEDVDRVVRALGIERFVLVGHSMSGMVMTAYAERHPEKLAGLVYVDAVGDLSGASPEMKAWFNQKPADYGPEQVQAEFSRMLDPKARPQTRERVLASVKRVAPATILSLRQALGAYAPGPGLAAYTGPRVAIEVEGEEVPFSASRSLPGVTRATLPNVSHWLMMDDPEGFNRALDAALAQTAP